MTLRFTKMHGLGNDFMVIDAINQSVHLSQNDIITLADRHTGIGFDQCLLVEPAPDKSADFFYRIFNADGQEVGQCGNGARCLARFVFHYGLCRKKQITVATKTTRMQLQLNQDDTVTVEFGIPHLEPALIPMQASEQAEQYVLSLKNGLAQSLHAINVGNPHAVMVVNDVASAPVASLGREISEHPFFPQQCNAGFMQIQNSQHISLRVYERGCGETSACGSGAVAAAAIGHLFHQMSSRIQVSLPGGNLWVEWPDTNKTIYLTGPACFVYEGVLPYFTSP